jgi:hypothetical protein
MKDIKLILIAIFISILISVSTFGQINYNFSIVNEKLQFSEVGKPSNTGFINPSHSQFVFNPTSELQKQLFNQFLNIPYTPENFSVLKGQIGHLTDIHTNTLKALGTNRSFTREFLFIDNVLYFYDFQYSVYRLVDPIKFNHRGFFAMRMAKFLDMEPSSFQQFLNYTSSPIKSSKVDTHKALEQFKTLDQIPNKPAESICRPTSTAGSEVSDLLKRINPLKLKRYMFDLLNKDDAVKLTDINDPSSISLKIDSEIGFQFQFLDSEITVRNKINEYSRIEEIFNRLIQSAHPRCQKVALRSNSDGYVEIQNIDSTTSCFLQKLNDLKADIF